MTWVQEHKRFPVQSKTADRKEYRLGEFWKLVSESRDDATLRMDLGGELYERIRTLRSDTELHAMTAKEREKKMESVRSRRATRGRAGAAAGAAAMKVPELRQKCGPRDEDAKASRKAAGRAAMKVDEVRNASAASGRVYSHEELLTKFRQRIEPWVERTGRCPRRCPRREEDSLAECLERIGRRRAEFEELATVVQSWKERDFEKNAAALDAFVEQRQRWPLQVHDCPSWNVKGEEQRMEREAEHDLSLFAGRGLSGAYVDGWQQEILKKYPAVEEAFALHHVGMRMERMRPKVTPPKIRDPEASSEEEEEEKASAAEDVCDTDDARARARQKFLRSAQTRGLHQKDWFASLWPVIDRSTYRHAKRYAAPYEQTTFILDSAGVPQPELLCQKIGQELVTLVITDLAANGQRPSGVSEADCRFLTRLSLMGHVEHSQLATSFFEDSGIACETASSLLNIVTERRGGAPEQHKALRVLLEWFSVYWRDTWESIRNYSWQTKKNAVVLEEVARATARTGRGASETTGVLQRSLHDPRATTERQ